jgi:hypothetical protein
MSTKICWYIGNIQVERKGTRKKRKFTVIDNGIRNTYSTNYFSEAKDTAFKHFKKSKEWKK